MQGNVNHKLNFVFRKAMIVWLTLFSDKSQGLYNALNMQCR